MEKMLSQVILRYNEMSTGHGSATGAVQVWRAQITEIIENQTRFKYELSDNLQACLKMVMSMNSLNPDAVVLEDPVRRFLIEEFRANNTWNDDRVTMKEFMNTISTLELGFTEEDLQALFQEVYNVEPRFQPRQQEQMMN